MTSPHIQLGRLGERAACRYLIRKGFDVLARGFRGRFGEIDLIALEGATLVFVEVKTRSTGRFGEPWEFVGWKKQQSLGLTADEFVARYDLGRYSRRFDIISVLAPGTAEQQITLYRDAF